MKTKCLVAFMLLLLGIALPKAEAQITVLQDISCNGGANGQLLVSPDFGTSPYTYSWSTTETTPSISGLSAGLYSVTVTDALLATSIYSVNLTDPPLLTVALNAQTNVNCFGSATGSIDVNVAGGVAPYLYNWSNGAVSQDIVNVPAGNYTIIVSDANGCTATANFTITEPPAITLSLTSTDVNCFGGNDGTATATAIGGTAPLGYLWSNGAITPGIINLIAGTYSVTVTDANGCTATDAVVINEPSTPLQLTGFSNNVTCFGGNNGVANVVVTGGVGVPVYLWSTGGTSPTINNLIAGIYTVTVTDGNGCIATLSDTITEPSTITVNITSQINVSCFGGNNGTVTVLATGGTQPLSYLWPSSEITPTISNLIAGNYTVTVTDGNGCTASFTATITEPPAITIVPGSITPSACDGIENGAATINVAGGTVPYSYQWAESVTDSTYTTQNLTNVRGGNYTVTVTDANGCTATNSVVIPNLAFVPVDTTVAWYVCNGTTGAVNIQALGADSAQYYTYSWSSQFENGSWTTNDSVFDYTGYFLAGDILMITTELATGCQNYTALTITQSATPLVVAHTQTDIMCYGDMNGSIALTPTGGDPMPGYHVTWTGPNGFSSSAFSISGLATGNYTYTVTDDSVCAFSETIHIGGPTSALQGHVMGTNISCNGTLTGTAEAVFSGGTGTLTYLWSNGDTTPVITGLPVGNYFVTVTDENGCTATGDTTLTQPGALNVIIDSIRDVSCFGGNDGFILTTATGGTGTLTYGWLLDGAIFPEITNDIVNIPAGMYTLTVTDENGCIVTVTDSVSQPTITTFSDAVHVISCNNGADGSWTITPNGAYGPYLFIFSTGDSISTDTVANPTISGLTAGSYSAICYANDGCSWNFIQAFEQPLPITASVANFVDVVCFGGATGSIALDPPQGGTAPYTYLWSNGMTTQTITNLVADIYTVTITDANGCTIQLSAKVDQPGDWITFEPTITATFCKQSEDGKVVVYANDIHDSPFNNNLFLYDSVGTLIASFVPGESVGNLRPGLYVIVLINGDGCTATDSIYVDPGPEDCLLIPNVVTPNDDGYNDLFWVGRACDYTEFSMVIYTNTGEQVFESTDCTAAWDPKSRKAYANTVYYYYITVNKNGKVDTYQSSINIQY